MRHRPDPKIPPLVLAVAALFGLASDGSRAQAPDAGKAATAWYRPVPEDFRPAYDEDRANREKESWDAYWKWVGDFYAGNLFSPGWTKQGEGILKVVKSDKTRAEIRGELNDLGRDICREWAKDNSLRKVDTAALQLWGRQMQQAARGDRGDGEAITTAVRKIRREYAKKMMP